MKLWAWWKRQLGVVPEESIDDDNLLTVAQECMRRRAVVSAHVDEEGCLIFDHKIKELSQHVAAAKAQTWAEAADVVRAFASSSVSVYAEARILSIEKALRRRATLRAGE